MEPLSATPSPPDYRDLDEEKANAALQGSPDENEKPIVDKQSSQDWDGPDDPGNPLNWSPWKKVYHTTMVGFLCFTM
jgi:hypothetical protein